MMRQWRLLAAAMLVLGMTMTIISCSPKVDTSARILGQSWSFGNGAVTAFAELTEDRAPSAIGLIYTKGALEGMPTAVSDQHHCFDRDSNGTVDQSTECFMSHEAVIPLPDAIATRTDIPFKWVLFNWNPMGHLPPGIYDVPHFDVHFYIEPIADVFAIQDGPCGPEFVRCDQFERGKRGLPENYIHPDYKNVDAVAPAMGNHLIDLTGPEFNGGKWERNWIFGTYDGKITFYEEMLTLEYLKSQPNTCNAIKSPPAVAISGFYPSKSCIRYDPSTDEYSVSMDGFEYREASEPGPVINLDAG